MLTLYLPKKFITQLGWRPKDTVGFVVHDQNTVTLVRVSDKEMGQFLLAKTDQIKLWPQKELP